MEFAEVPRGILLMHPPCPFTLLAKATLVARANFRDEPIVRLVWLETTREFHLVDLFAVKNTEKRLCSYTVLERRDDPVDCECAASCPAARFLKYEGIGLEWGCRLPSRSIVALFFRRWSNTWTVQLGRYDQTCIWRTSGTKRRMKLCVLKTIQLWCRFGGD